MEFHPVKENFMASSPQSIFMPDGGSGAIGYGGNAFTATLNVVLEGGDGLVLYNPNGGPPTTVLPQGQSQLNIGPNQLNIAWSGGGYKLAWWL